MGKRQVEIMQLITPDGVTYDLTSNSKKGNWVLEASGFGMPDIDYITQQGPFQHGVSVRDYRLQPRTIQLSLRQIACDRDEYWDRRTELLNALRPNRDPVGLSGALVARSQSIDETLMSCLCVFNNELYVGSQGEGQLYKWDGAYQLILKADTLNAQNFIYSLVVYDDGGGDDELYGSTGAGGRLFKWNGTDAWTQVCAQLGAETIIYDTVVFDDGVIAGDNIFAGTYPNGNLYYYNVGGAAWGQAAAQLGAETHILCLCLYDDGTGSGERLYGGTAPNGKLYRYDPAGGPPGTWVEVCAQLGAETYIYSLCIYNGELYGGTYPHGKLYHYDVTAGAWEEVAAQYNADTTHIRALIVYHGVLYGGSRERGLLLKWNGEDAWELAASQYSSENFLADLSTFNNRLFASSGSTYVGLLEYIRRAGQTTLPCATLRRILSDGSIRDLCVHPDRGPEFTSNKQGWDEHSIQEVIRLWAPDPVLYDPTQQIMGTYPVEAVTEYLIDENGDFILDENNDYIELEGAVAFSGAVNECWSIYYEGTWEEHPSFVITGPITNPVIRNDSTDEYIELDYEIEDGRIVTITLTPGNQTIVDDLGVNLIGSVTPESNLQSFHLGPDPEVDGGVNEICLTGTDADANTEFTIAFYNRYIGI